MSKDKKITITLNVEIVDNWIKMIDYIHSSISFWFPGNRNKWPFNLILDSLEDISKEIKESVSSSHIIDKYEYG